MTSENGNSGVSDPPDSNGKSSLEEAETKLLSLIDRMLDNAMSKHNRNPEEASDDQGSEDGKAELRQGDHEKDAEEALKAAIQAAKDAKAARDKAASAVNAKDATNFSKKSRSAANLARKKSREARLAADKADSPKAKSAAVRAETEAIDAEKSAANAEKIASHWP